MIEADGHAMLRRDCGFYLQENDARLIEHAPYLYPKPCAGLALSAFGVETKIT